MQGGGDEALESRGIVRWILSVKLAVFSSTRREGQIGVLDDMI
jgi:hypothetical protein